jgi:hypothetical protein
MERYLEDYRARSGKAVPELQSAIGAHILPELGERQVVSLTHAQIKTRHHRLAQTAARLRTSVHDKQQKLRAIEASDMDARRARRATANRILTVLKSALNLAYREGRASSDDAWRRVRPFLGWTCRASVTLPMMRSHGW